MNKKWWQDKVAYQIYPKSFKDTTGTGIGDIKGITSRLDYLKDLGIGMIWLSPCYCSPLADQGYDISDYYRIDPKFGSNEDLYELIAEARKKDIAIILDLVINHTSDEHEWFRKALEDPEGKYAKYYFIEDAVDGHAPNNWRSYFGGSAWEKIPGTDKYYLHLFHKKQPDLNWENREMREEIYRMINWWLDKGVAGFRLDAILNIKKPLPFKDYNFKPDRDDGMAAASQMISRAEGIGDLLREIRDRTFALHNAFSVGEVFNERDEQIPEFIGEDGYFSSMFDFRETVFGQSPDGWYANKPVMPDDYRDAVFTTQGIIRDRGFVSNIIENHDEPRGVSRYIPEGELSDTSKKFLATMQFMVRGLPFIYQGQEIGMENTVMHSIDEVDDISSRDEYQVALRAGLSEAEALRAVNKYSRDNARTPMQWDDSPEAGFTDGKPWLKVNTDYKEINVRKEEQDPASVLNYYKKLIAFRSDPEYGDTVVYGELTPWKQDTERLMAFYRSSEQHKLLVIGNFSTEEKTVALPADCRKVLLNNLGELDMEGRELRLKGYQAVVLLMEE